MPPRRWSRWRAARHRRSSPSGSSGPPCWRWRILPLSSAYSVAEAYDRPADVDDSPREAPLFYASYLGMLVVAGAVVLIPGAPLIPILFLSQALNALLLLVLLPFMRGIAADEEVMGSYRLGPRERVATAVAILAIG